MSEQLRQERRKEEAYITFGGPSHEGEYVFVTPDVRGNVAPEIVQAVTVALQATDWVVSNRGTRLEIRHKAGIRDDEPLTALLRPVLTECCVLQAIRS